MATYTPIVDLAVEIGDLFAKPKDSVTDSEPWEYSFLGINASVYATIFGLIAYIWRRMNANRRDYFGAQEPPAPRLNEVEDQV